MRAALLLWGGWTLVTALVFSLMEGIVPRLLHRRAGARHRRAGGRRRPRGVAGPRDPGPAVAFSPGPPRSPPSGPGCCSVARRRSCPGCAGSCSRSALSPRLGLLVPAGWRARVATVVAGAALIAGLAGPTAYAVQTAVTPHQGRIPTAGPSTGAGVGPGGRMRGRVDGAAAQRDGATAPDAAGRQDGAPGQPGGPGGFGMGGPGGEEVDAQLADMLTSAGTRWAAATMGSQGAATLELRTGTAVMAIGGFIGSDPSPTLEQFQAYVANGEIHYFIAGGMGGGPGRGNSEISQWVQQHFTAQTVGNQTVYDLTRPAS